MWISYFKFNGMIYNCIVIKFIFSKMQVLFNIIFLMECTLINLEITNEYNKLQGIIFKGFNKSIPFTGINP